MTSPKFGRCAAHHFCKYTVEIAKASESASITNIADWDICINKQLHCFLQPIVIEKFVESYVCFLCEQSAEVYIAHV